MNESRDYFLFVAHPAGSEILAQNMVGDEGFPTPSIAGQGIFPRMADDEGGEAE